MESAEYSVKREDLLYPELSFILVGCAFEVHNELGSGHQEKYYQRAYSVLLTKKNIAFKEQAYSPLIFQSKVIGRNYIDFLVEEKIVVELKKGNRFSKSHIDQVLNYLKIKNLNLAILINFTNEQVIYKRIINS